MEKSYKNFEPFDHFPKTWNPFYCKDTFAKMLVYTMALFLYGF